MKKILLTGMGALLFSIGAIAQVQDTTSINNNLRNGAQDVEERTEEAGNELRQRTEETQNDVNQGAQEVESDVKEGAQDVQEDAREAGSELREGAERTGNEIEQGAEKTGNEIEQGADRAGEKIEEGAERTGDQMEQGAERAKDKIEQNESPASQNSPGMPTSDASNRMGEAAPQADIEVMADKEGPNNQVVYKYQDGFYYVDREQKQLVKIEESQMKDAEHKAIVSDKE